MVARLFFFSFPLQYPVTFSGGSSQMETVAFSKKIGGDPLGGTDF